MPMPLFCTTFATESKNFVVEVNVFSMLLTSIAFAVSSRVTPVSSGTILNVPFLMTLRGSSCRKPGNERSLSFPSIDGWYPTIPCIVRTTLSFCIRSICTFESKRMMSSKVFYLIRFQMKLIWFHASLDTIYKTLTARMHFTISVSLPLAQPFIVMISFDVCIGVVSIVFGVYGDPDIAITPLTISRDWRWVVVK